MNEREDGADRGSRWAAAADSANADLRDPKKQGGREYPESTTTFR